MPIAVHGQIREFTDNMNAVVAYHNSSKHFQEMLKDLYVCQLVNNARQGCWLNPQWFYDTPPYCSPDLNLWPDDLRQFATSLSNEFSMEPWEICLAVMGIVAIASRGRYLVELAPYWVEAVTLYIVLAKVSGSRKSALFNILLNPLREYEQDQRNASTGGSDEIRKLVYQEQKKLALADIRSVLRNNDPDQLKDLIQHEGEKLEQMKAKLGDKPLPVLLAAHCTIPALEQEMSRQGGSVGICVAEDPFKRLQLLDKSRCAPEILLESYDLSDYYRPLTNRPPVSLYKASIAMLVGMQPEILLSYYDKPHLRDDGFLNRLTPCFMSKSFPIGQHSERQNIDVVRRRYDRKIRTLIETHFTQSSKREIYTLKVSPDAYRRVKAYENELDNYPRQMPAKGFFEKHHGRAVRIASCLHLWRHAESDPKRHIISDQDMEAAISLCQALCGHAEYAFDGEKRKLCKDARRVLQFIRRTGFGEFTSTDVSKNLENMPKDRLLPVLDFLERNRYIQKIHVPSRATICIVNPQVFNSIYP